MKQNTYKVPFITQKYPEFEKLSIDMFLYVIAFADENQLWGKTGEEIILLYKLAGSPLPDKMPVIRLSLPTKSLKNESRRN